MSREVSFKGQMIRIGVIGCGRWGKNLIRVFASLPDARLSACCNKSSDNDLQWVKTQHPHIETTHRILDIIENPKIDAVVVASPDQTHFEIAEKAIQAGKHVFVEKPLALSYGQAKDLVDLAENTNKILMVGHILQYHPSIQWMKERLKTKMLTPVSILSKRVELGITRSDANLLWSSAIHDVAVIQYILGGEPEEISAIGASLNSERVIDILFINLFFSGGIVGHIQAGFAGPYRERKLIIHTMDEIFVFDGSTDSLDILIRRFLKDDIEVGKRDYGKQFVRESPLEITNSPGPLEIECKHFLDSIINNSTPLSGGKNVTAVMRTLDRIEQLLNKDR